MTFLYNGKLNDLDFKIASFIERNPCFVTNNDIFTIANRIDVSASKITKYCQKIGLTGFKELRYKIAEILKVNALSSDDFSSQLVISDLIQWRSVDNFERCKYLITASKHIAIIATNEQIGLAMYLCQKLRSRYAKDIFYYEQHVDLENFKTSSDFLFIVLGQTEDFFKQHKAMKMRISRSKIIHLCNEELSLGNYYYPILVDEENWSFSNEIKHFIILTWLASF